MNRSPRIQDLAWLVSLDRNNQLNLDPPYQRKSFWNDSFRSFFIDSVLNGYPCPSIFLHQEISSTGVVTWHVIDGKQRIETVLAFANDEIPVPETYPENSGSYFSSLSGDQKKSVWGYQFVIETVDSDDPKMITQVFDRFNRNVGRLRPQELRHARHGGAFITLSEDLAESLRPGIPNISVQERKRMRDVEYVSNLLIYLIKGPRSLSQSDVDSYYAKWDKEVPDSRSIRSKFNQAVQYVDTLVDSDSVGDRLNKSRLANLSDYYSLFAAVASLQENEKIGTADEVAVRVADFLDEVETARKLGAEQGPDAAQTRYPIASRYY